MKVWLLQHGVTSYISRMMDILDGEKKQVTNDTLVIHDKVLIILLMGCYHV